jgi:hypothetical protein
MGLLARRWGLAMKRHCAGDARRIKRKSACLHISGIAIAAAPMSTIGNIRLYAATASRKAKRPRQSGAFGKSGNRRGLICSAAA